MLNDSLNISQTLKKQPLDTVFNQEKKETKKVLVKTKPKPIKIISSSLPDFTKYKNVKQKKNAFFSFSTPLIQNENNSIS